MSVAIDPKLARLAHTAEAPGILYGACFDAATGHFYGAGADGAPGGASTARATVPRGAAYQPGSR